MQKSSKMVHASTLQMKHLVLGMEFEYASSKYNAETGKFEDAVSIGKVTDLMTTKSGRISAEVNGQRWNNGPKSPTSKVQNS